MSLRPEVAIGGVAIDVRRGHGPGAGSWSVPGGRVEPGETLHEAVVREVMEETGLEVVVERFLGYGGRERQLGDGSVVSRLSADFSPRCRAAQRDQVRAPPNTSAPSCAAAASCIPGATWLWMSRVIAIDA